MTHSEINAMSKRELVKTVETIAVCAKGAWEHADDLRAKVDALYAEGNMEAAYQAQVIWQAFDSALQMANLSSFK